MVDTGWLELEKDSSTGNNDFIFLTVETDNHLLTNAMLSFQHQTP